MFSITAGETLRDADTETPGVQLFWAGDTDPVSELGWLIPAETLTEGSKLFQDRSPALFFPEVSRALRSRPRFFSSAMPAASSTVRVLRGRTSCPWAFAKHKIISPVQSGMYLFILKKYMVYKGKTINMA
jgi:hypothetical protein